MSVLDVRTGTNLTLTHLQTWSFHTVRMFIFIFTRIYPPPPPNYILSAEHPMVVSIVWILTGICKKED